MEKKNRRMKRKKKEEEEEKKMEKGKEKKEEEEEKEKKKKKKGKKKKKIEQILPIQVPCCAIVEIKEVGNVEYLRSGQHLRRLVVVLPDLGHPLFDSL